MQTTSTQERNTMKKALLTFIAIGSATIATVIAFASPASAEVIELEPQVEIAVIPELEVDEVLCPDCDPILPPVDPDPIVPTVTICIEINPGDCDLDPIIIDPINLIDPVAPKEEEDDPEEDGDESTGEIVEENVDAPAETEEIAITDEAPEEENQDTGDELPKTGVDIFHILLIALALLVAGSLLLASSKIKAAEKVVA